MLPANRHPERRENGKERGEGKWKRAGVRGSISQVVLPNFDSRHVCVKSFHLDNSDTVGHITRILAAKLQRCPTSFRTRIYRSLGDITFTLRYITSACTSSYFVSLLLHALFVFSNWKLEGYLVVSREREKVIRIFEKRYFLNKDFSMWLMDWYVIQALQQGWHLVDIYPVIIDFSRRLISFTFVRFYRRSLPFVPLSTPLAAFSSFSDTSTVNQTRWTLYYRCAERMRDVIIPMLNSILASC